MDHEIVVHLVPHMLEGEFAVIIVGVHLFGDRLVQLGIEEAKDLSATLWALQIFNRCLSYMMQDEDNEAGVEGGQRHHDALVALHGREHLVQEGVQIREAAHEDRYGD